MNPCDPAVGSLPEWSKWKSHGKEEMWKQVLLAREAIFLKRQLDSTAEQWQVYMLEHPGRYLCVCTPIMYVYPHIVRHLHVIYVSLAFFPLIIVNSR
jgi:hypothetical protein